VQTQVYTLLLARQFHKILEVGERRSPAPPDSWAGCPMNRHLRSGSSTAWARLSQWLIALVPGDDDLNDQDRLRPVHHQGPVTGGGGGQGRPYGQAGAPPAGWRKDAGQRRYAEPRSELTPADTDRDASYKRIVADQVGRDCLRVQHVIECQLHALWALRLDLDATDGPRGVNCIADASVALVAGSANAGEKLSEKESALKLSATCRAAA